MGTLCNRHTRRCVDLSHLGMVGVVLWKQRVGDSLDPLWERSDRCGSRGEGWGDGELIPDCRSRALSHSYASASVMRGTRRGKYSIR